MGVQDFYASKAVLLTGVTGFIGKVIYEKFLRCIGNVGCLYILIRGNSRYTAQQRFDQEIMRSRCFDVCRQQIKNFEDFLRSKTVVVQGDLHEERLGLTQKDYNKLTQEINIIINCAASTQFNSPLNEALEINVAGTLRVFEFARKCRNLENFLHVSTAYVNSNRIVAVKNFIEEKIYETEYSDPLEHYNMLKSQAKETLIQNQNVILGTHPNTYTYSKALAERIIQKIKGDVPTTIFRPSIVGAAWQQPFPGWVDTISASGALFVLGGLGILQSMEAQPEYIGDQVPVDVVSDYIIVSAARYAKCKNLTVLHCGSSTVNPVTFIQSIEYVSTYYIKYQFSQRIFPVNFKSIKNPTVFKLLELKNKLPLVIYEQFAKLGNKNTQKNIEKLKKLYKKEKVAQESFKHFMVNQFLFQMTHTQELLDFLNKDEKHIYLLTCSEIDWLKYFSYFAWGLQKFMIKDDVDEPNILGKTNLFLKHPNLLSSCFPDIEWIRRRSDNNKYTYTYIQNKENLVVGSTRVQTHFKTIKNSKKLEERAQDIIYEGFGKQNSKAIQVAAFSQHKFLNNFFDYILINEDKLEQLKIYQLQTHGPIILVPTYKSYIDILLIPYIFFAYQLKCPVFAVEEILPKNKILQGILKSCGGFYMNQQLAQNDKLYNDILTEYITQYIKEKSILQFFVEGARSQSGKIGLSEQYSVYEILVQLIQEGVIPDVQMVPVSISYDKVLDLEINGLDNFFKMAKNLKEKNQGKIFVEFSSAFSLKKYINDTGTLRNLQREIVTQVQETQIIVPSQLVATVLLLNRNGLTEDKLYEQVDWIGNEVIKRGYSVSNKQFHDEIEKIVQRAITHLGDSVYSYKGVVEPGQGDETHCIQKLSYYRNGLFHVFVNEAKIILGVMSNNIKKNGEGIQLENLMEDIMFIDNILEYESATRQKLSKPENIQEKLNQLKGMGYVNMVKGKKGKMEVQLGSGATEMYLALINSMIVSILQTYWFTITYIGQLIHQEKNNSVYQKDKFINQIWWFGKQLLKQKILNYQESVQTCYIDNCLKMLTQKGVLKYNQQLSHFSICASLTVIKQLESSVYKFIQNHQSKSIQHNLDTTKKIQEYELASPKL